MAKRWSKLKKQIEDLFIKGLALKVHCTDIRTTPDNDGTFPEVLGVFTIRLGKEIIWNFPRQFVDKATMYPGGGNPYSYGVRDLNTLLRDYLDTPKDKILKDQFPLDYFGMVNILKAADRRIGLEKLETHFKHVNQSSVMKILSARRILQSA